MKIKTRLTGLLLKAIIRAMTNYIMLILILCIITLYVTPRAKQVARNRSSMDLKTGTILFIVPLHLTTK